MTTRTNDLSRTGCMGAVLLACAATIILSGCSGPSVWEQSYVAAPSAAEPALATDEPVRIRSIPWERMQDTLAEMEHQAATSDVHPEDWSPQRREQAKAELLRGLQFPGDPARTAVVGRCEFRTTDTIMPDGADRERLEKFARKVGATDVIWSRKILGRTQKIVDQPVTTNSFGTFWGGGHHNHDRWWDNGYSESTTSWVPMAVPADDTGFVAFFLRSS